jgi:predicted metal-dependent hydrolase
MIARVTPNPLDWEQLPLLDMRDAARDAWRVRPSLRARRLAVRVLPGGVVEIVIPRGTRPRTIEAFVSRHRRWIERKLDQYRPLEAGDATDSPAEIHFMAIGQRYAVEYVEANSAPHATLCDARIRVRGDLTRTALVRHALQRLTMRRAHAAFEPWLAQLALATGLNFRRLEIRRQRTRWGSCSPSGTISLNACLMFQPRAVVNYLLIHELAHTRHMNHSRRFWALVERLEPEWRELDRALSHGWRRVPAWLLD